MKSVLLFLLIIFSLGSSAAVYYVSPTGSDTTGDGTISSPWFTLNKAWTVVAAGDVVYMRGGTYTYTSTQVLTGKNGTSGSRITVTAYPNEKPVIRKGTPYAYHNRNATSLIYVSGNYITLSKLELTGFTQEDTYLWVALRLANINYCTFDQLKIHGNSSGVYLSDSSTGNILNNCDIYNNFDPLSNDSYGNGDGIAIAWIPAGSSNTLKGCRIFYNADDGLDCWNNEGLAIIDGCWIWMNGYREDHAAIGGDGNALKLGLTQTSNGSVLQRDIRNNLIFKNRAHAIDQNGGVVLCHVYNNTIWNNVIGINLWDYSLAHIIRNNAVFGNTNNYSGGDYSNSTRDHNSYHATWQPLGVVTESSDFASIDTTGVSSARQSDGSLPIINFLRLSEGSRLRDAGTDVGIPYSGSAPDMGAFEYAPQPIPSAPLTKPIIKGGKVWMKNKKIYMTR